MDEAGPSLGRVDFFNYGEAFLHKRAVEMCEYVKAKFPHIYLYTSTNGLALNDAVGPAPGALGDRRGHVLDRRRLAGDATGATGSAGDSTWPSPTCARWRTRSARPAATCPSSTGATSSSPGTTATKRWGARARWRPTIGVDRLTWEITDHPEDSFSRRFVPGSPDYERIKYEIWDTNNLGNAIPGAMPRARIDVSGTAAGPAARRAARAHALRPDARAQSFHAPVPARGQLRPPPRAPRRPVVRRRRHRRRPRLRARVAAAHHRRRRTGRRPDRDSRPRRAQAATSSSSTS